MVRYITSYLVLKLHYRTLSELSLFFQHIVIKMLTKLNI